MFNKIIVVSLLTLSISGCGGGNSSATDTTPPTIVLNGPNPVTISFGGTYTEAGATANDDTDGQLTATTTGTVNTSIAGNYTITYSAIDAAGNQATRTRTVTVVQPPSNSYKSIVGDWITTCSPTSKGKSAIASVSFPDKVANKPLTYTVGGIAYNTSNCTGSYKIVVFAGPISYQGAYPTSTCMSEKTNVNLVAAIVDGTDVEGAQLKTLLKNISFPNPMYNISCKYRGNVINGARTTTLDGSSNSKRPTKMHLNEVFKPWARSKSLSKTKGSEISKIQAYYLDFKSAVGQ